MSKSYRKFMANFRRRLTHLTKLEQTHCGHLELVEKSVDYRFKFEKWVEEQIERLKKESVDEYALTVVKGFRQ